MPVVMEPEEPGVRRTEMQEIQLRAAHVTDESLESTRRMKILCEESKEAGLQTMVHIDEQGEQLDGIEDNMNTIKADILEAEKNLAGMEKCCGLCVLPWKKGASFKEAGDTWSLNDDGKVVNNQPKRVITNQPMIVNSGYIARITDDAREDEMEENISQVNIMVSSLRNMAQDLGCEIENQNRQIDRINNKADSNVLRIEGANKRAHELLK